MKKELLLVSFLLIIFTIAKAQYWPIDPETKKITYTEIVNVDSVSKEALYLRAKDWFAKTYISSKEVIQLDDRESGKIIGKGSFDIYYSDFLGKKPMGFVTYTIELSVKEGRYKYTITDLWHDGGTSGISSPGNLLIEKSWPATKGAWNGVKEQTKDHLLKLIDNLKLSMSKPTDENW